MDEPGEHYATWNNPKKDKYCMSLLHDLIMWNLKKIRFTEANSRMVVARAGELGKWGGVGQRLQTFSYTGWVNPIVQVVQSCLTLCDPMDTRQSSLSFTISRSLLKLMSIGWWCHPTISSSVIPFSFFLSDKMWSTGEGNGKPLQHSCLENPMTSMNKSWRSIIYIMMTVVNNILLCTWNLLR